MALFVAAGTAASCNDRLTMYVRGSFSSLRHSFNRAVGKASRSHVADEDSNMILRTSMVSVEGNTSSLERTGFWSTACRNWFTVSCFDSSDRKSLILTILSTKKALKEEAKSSLRGASGNTGSEHQFKIFLAVEKSFLLSSCDSRMHVEKHSVFAVFRRKLTYLV